MPISTENKYKKTVYIVNKTALHALSNIQSE